MPTQRAKRPLDPAIVSQIAPGFLALGASWRRSLRARNHSARTIETYLDAHKHFGVFLVTRQMPQEARQIKRAHVEAFIAQQLDDYAPATANNRYRALQQWFKWLCEEEEITASPMEHMTPPAIPEAPPPVMVEDQLRAILHVCRGNDFRARRDTAIIRLLVDTGMRRSEMASILVENVKLDAGELRVEGKGKQGRIVPFGSKAAAALDRYLRVRAQHPNAVDPHLWLGWNGHSGPTTPKGIYQVVRDRAAEAGLPGVYTHLFRHTWTDEWLAGGGSEGDAMEIAGWRSRSMLDRYGRAARSKRARDAHKKLSPGDRI